MNDEEIKRMPFDERDGIFIICQSSKDYSGQKLKVELNDFYIKDEMLILNYKDENIQYMPLKGETHIEWIAKATPELLEKFKL